jgi:hypothetical protein
MKQGIKLTWPKGDVKNVYYLCKVKQVFNAEIVSCHNKEPCLHLI